jgi:hypothetical protein
LPGTAKGVIVRPAIVKFVEGHDLLAHARRIENVEDGVASDRLMRLPRCGEDQGLPLPQGQKACDMVDVAIGDDHGGDGAVALSAWFEGMRPDDLLAKIGRSVQQDEAIAVRSDREAGLGRGLDTRIAAPCKRADGTTAIPLRIASARSCAQDAHGQTQGRL